MTPKENDRSSEILQDSLSLKEFMQAVRDELVDAEEERREKGHEPLFQVESLQIEASVVVRKKLEGKTGFNIQVVSIGGSGGIEHEAAHRITLTLSALGEQVSPVKPEESTLANLGGILGDDENADNSEYRLGVQPVALLKEPNISKGVIYFDDLEYSEDE